ncbi:FAD-dependent oxidoreductase [Paraglaciecola sp. Hal342]
MFHRALKRRDFLQGLGAGAVAASLNGCAQTPVNNGFVRPFSRRPMVAPKVSANNIITQIVGHRPYRPAGFVVKAKRLAIKPSAHLWTWRGRRHPILGLFCISGQRSKNAAVKEAAIIGGGVMGLTTARLLQEAGWCVTIYTREMARHTTSQVAGGEWGPFSVHDPLISSDAFKLQLQLAAQISHETFARMVGNDYGIQWMELYSASQTAPKADSPFNQFYPFRETYGPGKHPFSTKYCTVSATMLVETSTFLRRLIRDVRLAGGEFVIRNVKDKEELHALQEPVVFNCTGLGSRVLFADEGIMPAKGQLILLPPDPAVDYLTVGGGSGKAPLYMFSRNDYMILGGTFKVNDWTTHPEPLETERILSESQAFFAGL